jgi:peptidoglycan/xylan/chitin deacetylase (PgdA/CDA1 family)
MLAMDGQRDKPDSCPQAFATISVSILLSISWVAKMSEPALVSITFDDGLRCQLDTAVPILDRHGFPATFFLVANTDPIHTDGVLHPDWPKTTWSRPDIELLKKMIQRGHEVGSHSVSHRRPELDDDPRGEAEKSKRWIEDRLEVEIPSYCYPFYHISKPIKQAVIDAGYRQARGPAREPYYNQSLQADYFDVGCRQIGEHSFEMVGDLQVGKDGCEDVGSWLKPGCWHVLTFHGIGNLNNGWFPISLGEFTRQIEDLARYRDSGVVEVLTFKQGAERQRKAK